MANINVKVNPVTSSKVKQIAIGQLGAQNVDLGDLRDVDTTTVIASNGDIIVFDANTQKYEAAAGIDGGYYG